MSGISLRVRRWKRRRKELLKEIDRVEGGEEWETALKKYRELESVLENLVNEGVELEKNQERLEECRHRIKVLEDWKGVDQGGEDDGEAGTVQVEEEGEGLEEDSDSSGSGSGQGSFKGEEPGHDFEEVVGMENVKQEFRDKVLDMLKDRDEYNSYGIEESVNGVMLHGPPGVGKSFISEAVAGELDGTYIEIGGGDIKDKYVGESESNIKNLVQDAIDSEPCVVVIDEIDRLTSNRDERHSSSAKPDMVSTFLDEIEKLSDHDVVFVGTTNFLSRIDDAFLRPGRFSKQIFVPLPDEDMRTHLMADWLGNVDESNLATNSIDLRTLARKTEEYTCADLVEQGGLMYEAAIAAKKTEQPIQQKHLEYAYRKTEPSVENPDRWR